MVKPERAGPMRTDPRRIRINRPYTVEEAARMLGKHKQTVRNWIKGGLPTVDQSRPIMIHGHELRSYLERKRKAAKRPCQPGTLYCLKCNQPRKSALGMVEVNRDTATTGNLKALCEVCGTVMHRRIRIAAIPDIFPNLAVEIREARASLAGNAKPSLNCNFGKV
jgi:hypothetical protein